MKKIFLLGLCSIILLTGCSGKENENEKNNNNNGNSKIEVKVNQEDSLNLKHTITEGNDIVINVKNTGKELIDYVNIDVALYDEKDNLVRVEKQYVRNILPNSESYVKVDLTRIQSDGKNSAMPSRIELSGYKTIYSTKTETVYSDKVTGSVEKTETEGRLNLTVSNNSGVVLDDLSASVVFYKNGKILDIYTTSIQNVQTTATQLVYVPTILKDGRIGYISYDEAKVIINNASKYNTGL